MKNKKIPTVLLLPHQFLPIPAVGGGAIETLITSLLDENEKKRLLHFVVPSIYDKRAASINYRFSSIFYFEKGWIVDWPSIVKIEYLLYRLIKSCIRIIMKIACHDDTAKIKTIDTFVFQLRKIVKRKKVDILINESTDYSERFKPLIDIVGKKNSFYCFHWFAHPNPEIQKLYENTISLSKIGRETWLSNGFNKGKHYVVYNGIDNNIFSQSLSEVDKKIIKQKIGLNDDNIVIFTYCGRIIKEKGVLELINAFSSTENKNIVLLVVGSVNFSLPDTTDYSKSVISLINSDQRIKYLGYFDNKELYKIYNITDVLIIPSICEECAALVPIEGMSCGLPLITTKRGGVPEYVDDSCSIQINVDSMFEGRLTNSIELLAKDEELRKKMSLASYERGKKFTSEICYDNFCTVIFNHIGEKPCH